MERASNPCNMGCGAASGAVRHLGEDGGRGGRPAAGFSC
ncbi:hypothetical protein PVAP13_9NG323473 [Panicum virgatum]|uniref:Uncharacterized protein n=1 Tax=Panicum virgatum TaxID=38727 RepID=A0A8T0MP32_PANVG|nr:hypothetical protein PVAP13_9NG323473 [Panicum virgatum]